MADESEEKFNPWDVSTIQDFLFYCCPECPYKSQDVQGFGTHAEELHPESIKSIEKMRGKI